MQKIGTSCLFLILICLCSSFSSAISFNKKSMSPKPVRANLPALVGLDEFKSKYVIDDVLSLMQSLVDAAQKEVDEFNANWATAEAEKKSSLNALATSLNTQAQACDDLNDKLTTLNDTINDLNEQILEYNQSISDNEDKIASLLASRCDSNRNYVQGLKNNKKTLSLIQVIREAVQNFNETLLQRHVYEEIHSKLLLFLEKYSGRKSFLQSKASAVPSVPDVQERTAEEIGTGYIDNPYGEITVDDFDSETISTSMKNVKTKLLNILDDLEANVKSDMATAEANEIAANVAAASVKLNLDTENRFLKNQILTLQKQLSSDSVDFENVYRDWKDCRASWESFSHAYDVAKEDLDDAIANYNAGLVKLNEELALFQEVLYMYQNQVASTSEDYKARADDYVDDQTFNNGQNFDNRSIYDVMGNSLAEKKN